jgi:hypothetical protein
LEGSVVNGAQVKAAPRAKKEEAKAERTEAVEYKATKEGPCGLPVKCVIL